ncbi:MULTISPECIES: dTDP-4-dehydrorhamnose reductase [Acetobacterium]|uniref:dTDP-4-dehydrorhamnose reductase n=1 Tax=Acetobacterium wieringae TaxID=52694 RepID=A0A1F2PGX1_9FIRM|nr:MULTISPECIES: dTDP-4-dehydrorhamnose reductase [Acetobacterium]OFV70132.1 dTDP-4-dehydrorhamnose reductase [Acetobacterium wieringae]OXS24474.1 MAG: dTDP-4-dehydrorhamnose reductase [Acetobacterium sp. MES1]URN84635.1 dTDP-4-dehydrorhamnose reductase [Acetobacterium wieringae]
MKILLTGSNGQLGRELTRQLAKKKIDFVGYDIPEFDITDKEKMTAIITSEQPTVIINCGALTNVDGCETQKELAMAINATGPQYLAEIARDRDIVLVQVSTDYVFDGSGIIEAGAVRPYRETDPTDPKTVYGESKAAGEKAVSEIAPKYFIVRTAWLYGDGNNFVKTMLELASKHPKLTVVNDQIGSPTSTVDLAAAIIDLIHTDHYGIYHGTCEGQCSWYDFAIEIFRLSGIDIPVEPVTSEQFVRPAPRPKYSVLENKALNDLQLNQFRPWQISLVEYLDNLTK